MDMITNLLANEQLQTAFLGIFGILLTLIINRVAAAITLATGMGIEQKHRDALHEAIKTGVESALVYGPDAAFDTIKANVVQHIKASVPDALRALMPTDNVISRLIERYLLEALAKVGEPK